MVVTSSTISSNVDPPVGLTSTAPDRSLRNQVATARLSVGLPETVADPAALARIAVLIIGGVDLASSGVGVSQQQQA